MESAGRLIADVGRLTRPPKGNYGRRVFLHFFGIPLLRDADSWAAESGGEQKTGGPLLPGLLLLGEKRIETADLIEAAVGQNRKLDELSVGVFHLRRGRLVVGNLEVGIGIGDFKFFPGMNE